MKVSELEGHELDAWAAHADGFEDGVYIIPPGDKNGSKSVTAAKYPRFIKDYSPSTNWAHGGPIIERERITVYTTPKSGVWGAWIHRDIAHWGPEYSGEGPTPLIAAMRCFVASKFGDEAPDAEQAASGRWASTTDAFIKPPFKP